MAALIDPAFDGKLAAEPSISRRSHVLILRHAIAQKGASPISLRRRPRRAAEQDGGDRKNCPEGQRCNAPNGQRGLVVSIHKLAFVCFLLAGDAERRKCVVRNERPIETALSEENARYTAFPCKAAAATR